MEVLASCSRYQGIQSIEELPVWIWTNTDLDVCALGMLKTQGLAYLNNLEVIYTLSK